MIKKFDFPENIIYIGYKLLLIVLRRNKGGINEKYSGQDV